MLLTKSIHQHSPLPHILAQPSPQPKSIASLVTTGCKRTCSKPRFGEFFYPCPQLQGTTASFWVPRRHATCQTPHRHKEPPALSQSSPKLILERVQSTVPENNSGKAHFSRSGRKGSDTSTKTSEKIIVRYDDNWVCVQGRQEEEGIKMDTKNNKQNTTSMLYFIQKGPLLF